MSKIARILTSWFVYGPSQLCKTYRSSCFPRSEYFGKFCRHQLLLYGQGGLKAVVWTDALQLVLLALASVVIIILGVLRVGGVDVVMDRALEGERIEFFK